MPVAAVGRIERAAEETDARHNARTASTHTAPALISCQKGKRMVGNLEALGDAVTGGVIGHAGETPS